ncbi:signal peptidase I [Advenella sp. WQ 585]|uniref:Signal peptidase I n=1 Tax=Advenella mandrilli TaxID=2800330 RepID=A0ABS1EFV5_9BURK|nr:signal peptidase I [Advenella mandrilli]MBK1781000.1 signal peptidase I [Advenella mandrilli]
MDFALILFVLLLLTAVIKLIDKVVLKPRRIEKYGQEQEDYRPWWVEYAVSFFPVILFVFILRSFVVEPFRIPSGSMLPTLQDGDMILVNKFNYGIRLPIVDQKIIPLGNPKKGDVVVFRYPVNTDIDYIKRVVGVSGDTVAYIGKRLFINGEPLETTPLGPYVKPSQQVGNPLKLQEKTGDASYEILNMPGTGGYITDPQFPFVQNCEYAASDFKCTVPEGHYFVMGDNRDNSEDSRYWGFVPDNHLVGKAFFVWMNFGDLGRIGSIK